MCLLIIMYSYIGWGIATAQAKLADILVEISHVCMRACVHARMFTLQDAKANLCIDTECEQAFSKCQKQMLLLLLHCCFTSTINI